MQTCLYIIYIYIHIYVYIHIHTHTYIHGVCVFIEIESCKKSVPRSKKIEYYQEHGNLPGFLFSSSPTQR